MKRILVLAYLRNNVGDDLFVNQLVNRYPDDKFYIRVINQRFGEPFKQCTNVEIVKVENENFEDINLEQYDAFIYIGGSIFMEGGKVYNLDEGCLQFVTDCKAKNKPFFYISSNYGPFKTNEYFELSRKVFSNCRDLCFRDLYSYELFKDINTIRYAPDIVFSYPIDKIEKKKNSVGISLIDLEIRDTIRKKEQEYIEFMVKNIKMYIEQDKKVYLFSFCQYEGDEKMIEKLKMIMPEEFERENIIIVQYRGDIDEFLTRYSEMEYMICERFHSVILSCICNQKFYVISYSKKIDNILKELNIANDYIKFEQIQKNQILSLDNFKNVDEDKLNNLKMQAEKQFEATDKYLKG